MASQTRPASLFFIHVPKTGGLTVNQHVYDHLEGELVYPESPAAPGEQFTDIGMMEAFLQESDEPPRFVSGHFPFFMSDKIDIPFVTASVLRDPVERTLSQLRMIADEDPAVADLSPEEIYDLPFYHALLLDNVQTRLLSATEEDDMKNFMDHFEIDADRLEAAMRNLRRIDILGVQEELDTFLARLRAHFGWPWRPVENVNVRQRDWTITDAFRRRIAEDCKFDCELYAFARRLLN